MHMPAGRDYRIYPLGDAALEVCFGDRIAPAIHQRVLSLWYALLRSPLIGQTDLTPAYSTLAVHIDPLVIGANAFTTLQDELRKRIDSLDMREVSDSPLLHVPVCYEEACAPDMPALVDRLQQSSASIIRHHTSTVYSVYLLGFLPGFPYMGTLPEEVRLPRKERPDPVARGTVAIAANQTGIYPSDSPGGWWRIGQTPLRVFDANDPRVTLFEPGDHIRFYPIDHHTFLSVERSVRDVSFSTLREKGGWI